MILNDNAIDYVYWDDPNELVDRLRLLDASYRAGNNSRQRDAIDYRGTSRSRSYYKLNHVSMKRISRVTPSRKNTYFLVPYILRIES